MPVVPFRRCGNALCPWLAHAPCRPPVPGAELRSRGSAWPGGNPPSGPRRGAARPLRGPARQPTGGRRCLPSARRCAARPVRVAPTRQPYTQAPDARTPRSPWRADGGRPQFPWHHSRRRLQPRRTACRHHVRQAVSPAMPHAAKAPPPRAARVTGASRLTYVIYRLVFSSSRMFGRAWSWSDILPSTAL